jgi:hypothetical protein
MYPVEHLIQQVCYIIHVNMYKPMLFWVHFPIERNQLIFFISPPHGIPERTIYILNDLD